MAETKDFLVWALSRFQNKKRDIPVYWCRRQCNDTISKSDPSKRYRWYRGEFSPHYWESESNIFAFSPYSSLRCLFLWKRLIARLMVWKRRHANVWGISKSCKEINLSFFADTWSLVFERVELALKKMTIGLPHTKNGNTLSFSLHSNKCCLLQMSCPQI